MPSKSTITADEAGSSSRTASGPRSRIFALVWRSGLLLETRGGDHEVVLVEEDDGGVPNVPASAREARSVPKTTTTSAPAVVATGGVVPTGWTTEGPRASASATSVAMVLVPLATTYTASADRGLLVSYGGKAEVSNPWFPSQVLTSLAPCADEVPFATRTLIAACATVDGVVGGTGRVVLVGGTVVVWWAGFGEADGGVVHVSRKAEGRSRALSRSRAQRPHEPP